MIQNSINIAALQINGSGEWQENVAKITKLAEKAKDCGAEFITTPENSAFMEKDLQKALEKSQDPANPHFQNAMQELASRLKIWLAVGSQAMKTQSGKSFNQSVVFNPKGEIIACYNKIHLFDVHLANGEHYDESDRIEGGNKAVTFQTPWGKMGLTICYDLRFPHLFRTLAQDGARLILTPAAFTVPTGEAHWHVLLRARAIENSSFIVAAAQWGTHNGNRKTFGHSLIVNPWGKVIAEIKEGENFILSHLDLKEADSMRQNLPSLYADREFSKPI